MIQYSVWISTFRGLWHRTTDLSSKMILIVVENILALVRADWSKRKDVTTFRDFPWLHICESISFLRDILASSGCELRSIKCTFLKRRKITVEVTWLEIGNNSRILGKFFRFLKDKTELQSYIQLKLMTIFIRFPCFYVSINDLKY